MRAAKSWSIPPLTLWGGDGTWTDRDRLLVQALHLYERGLCPGGCGQPMRIAHDDRFKEWWSREHTICHACAALQGEQSKTTPPPGQLAWVEFDLGWERSFPS